MWVRITKSKSPHCWYANAVGGIFRVTDTTPHHVIDDESKPTLRMIRADCFEAVPLREDLSDAAANWRWIPVGDRLPETYMRYPVLGLQGSLGLATYNTEAKEWEAVAFAVREPITHWLPVPAAPVTELPLATSKAAPCSNCGVYFPGKMIELTPMGHCTKCGRDVLPNGVRKSNYPLKLAAVCARCGNTHDGSGGWCESCAKITMPKDTPGPDDEVSIVEVFSNIAADHETRIADLARRNNDLANRVEWLENSVLPPSVYGVKPKPGVGP